MSAEFSSPPVVVAEVVVGFEADAVSVVTLGVFVLCAVPAENAEFPPPSPERKDLVSTDASSAS
jgi:hypothetical protein